ncbi:dihydrofolate reductase [Pseudochelatococcus lubricantis]|uniref:Dihydrofolate reductase n=1 Tax=Pseudochelatococcus lubricantis TaxID=1538102 RepID=A0ABX0V5D0_9HYPH|nr:dihydrofolate reductase family protein [Pseudochelatococcus lubricantis]NIJ59803.1 dihydrofolate reductase [Pseudochelatococcus lubricantis]
MRRLTVAAFLSLDGVMQAPGGPEEDTSGGFAHGGWIVPHFDAVTGEVMGRLFEGPIALLLGRKTYDIFAAHWPRVQDDPFADSLNVMTKYVATRSLGPLAWSNSHAIGPDGADAVRRLKAEDGPDLLTQGSSDLIQSLLAADLVDRFTLLTFPVLLGAGKRLFHEGTKDIGLKLTGSRNSTTGVVISTYERAGPVRTGSFALDPA